MINSTPSVTGGCATISLCPRRSEGAGFYVCVCLCMDVGVCVCVCVDVGVCVGVCVHVCACVCVCVQDGGNQCQE